MWVIETKKYAGILSTLVGLNNIVNVSYSAETEQGILRVSTPSRVGYAELLVPELTDKIDKLFNFTPLLKMFSSKVATKVFFSPPAQMAMYREPYTFKETIPEMDDSEEWGGINEARPIPSKILEACAGTYAGIYTDDQGTTAKIACIHLDNVIFVDMARRLGAPRTIMTVTAGPEGLKLTDIEGRACKYPKPKDSVYPAEDVSVMLSMETQPMVFASLLGQKSYMYLVDDRFVLIDSAAGLFTFICASYAGGHADFEGYEI